MKEYISIKSVSPVTDITNVVAVDKEGNFFIPKVIALLAFDCIDEYGKAFSNVVFMGARSLKTALEGTGSKLWSVDGATIDILGSKWGKIYDEITAEDLQGIFESAEEFYDEEKDIDGEQFKAYLENARNCIYQSKVPIAKNVIEILESNIHSFEFLINKVSLIN